MKKELVYLLLFGILFSCKEDDTNDDVTTELLSRYQLIEILADPGDGSGTFQPVTSDKVIELRSNNTITSNGDICSMSTEANTPTSGTYSLTDSTVHTSNCHQMNFELSEHELIIIYPCFEACQAKFEKR